MNQPFDGSADLLMNVVGTMVIMLAVFVPLAQLEQLTYMDNQADSNSQQEQEADEIEKALVEIAMGEDGKTTVFSWQANGQATKVELPDYDALQQRIEKTRPDAIKLRIDRNVPSGVMQDLVVASSELNFAIFQSNRTGE